MRNISFFLTTEAIEAGIKTVTRRIGWTFLKPGDVLRGIKKGQGLKRGEKIETLCFIKVVSVRQEPLRRLIDEPEYGEIEATREGFPGWSGQKFVDFLREKNRKVTPDTVVTRIEFAYFPAEKGNR